MPNFRPSPDLDMHYEVDDFTDPWRQPETILMLHGNAESGLAWYAWVPALARQYRVVRPDMRGFGQSTPMPRDYPWTLDRLIEDFCLLMDHLGDRPLPSGRRQDRRHDRPRLRRAPARAGQDADRGRHAAAAASRRRRKRAAAVRDVRDARGRILGPAEHGQPARQRLSAGGVRMVVQIHGPHRGLDAARLHGHDRLRRHPRRPAEDRLPDAGHHHRGKRARARSTRPAPGSSRSQIRELVVLPGNSYHVAATHADRAPARRSTSSPDAAAEEPQAGEAQSAVEPFQTLAEFTANLQPAFPRRLISYLNSGVPASGALLQARGR